MEIGGGTLEKQNCKWHSSTSFKIGSFVFLYKRRLLVAAFVTLMVELAISKSACFLHICIPCCSWKTFMAALWLEKLFFA